MNKHALRARDYMEHMLDAAVRTRRYVEGMTLASFKSNELVQDAVLRNIGIIGEASKNLQDVLPDASARFPTIPFDLIDGMRNRVIHAYFVVDLDIVWNVVTHELNFLIEELPSAIQSVP